MHSTKTLTSHDSLNHMHFGVFALGFTVLAMIDAFFGGHVKEAFLLGANEYAAVAIVGIVGIGVIAKESLTRPSLVRSRSLEKL